MGDGPRSVAVADLSGDLKIDLAVANTLSYTVGVLVNQGSGAFVPHVAYATGDLPVSVVGADLGGDGKLDLAVANFTRSSVRVLLTSCLP